MDVSKPEQIYKLRIEELEKQVESRNFKIDSLSKEIKFRSDELTRQIEKHQIACEARDESKFRVAQLEKDVSVLRNENNTLISQLKEQKIHKNSRELSLEAVVASNAEQIKQYEERIEAYESKISQLEANRSASLSEKSFGKQSNVSSSEDCLKILQLESDLKLLSLENEDLRTKLGEEKERKESRLETLEMHLKNCTDKLQKYEQTIKECKSKISYLETEKKEMICKSEKHLSERKKLQAQLETHQNSEKKSEEEKVIIAQLQEELSNLKSLSKKQIQPDTEMKLISGISPVTRGVLELQECKSILTIFAEQHRNLQMKFEQEMKDKLLQIEETISKEHNILKVKNPGSLQDGQLPKAGKPEEYLEMVEKDISTKSQKKGQEKTSNTETKALQSQNKIVKPKAASQKELQEKEKDHSVHTPIKPQNKRLQKAGKTEVKDSESQNTVKPDDGSNVSPKEWKEKVEKDDSVRTPLKPQNRRQEKPSKTEVKKKTNKNKKIKDNENVYSTTGPKDSVSENIKTAVEGINPIPNEGRRQLRTRRK